MIKKHELTRKKKEEDRTKLTNIQSANVGPVFMTYHDSGEINSIVSKTVSFEPYFDVTTEDGVQHAVKLMKKFIFLNKNFGKALEMRKGRICYFSQAF